jgi:C-terminal processing protease CtpA/Prc
MTPQRPDGIPVWAWLFGIITVAIIGAYATIKSHQIDPYPTSSPSPNPNSTTTVSKHCVGIIYYFYQNINLNQNQPPISASVISSILPGYPADFSQLRPGDMIISVNGESVTRDSTLAEQEQLSDNHVNLRIIRPSSYYFGGNNKYWIYPPYQEYNLQVPIKNDCKI